MSKAKFSFDAATDQLRRRQLELDNQKRYAPSSSRVYFEPTLLASTPPSGYEGGIAPNANVLRAFYVRQDDRFDMWFSLSCGIGFNPGAGSWTMTLPFPIPTNLVAANAGHWQGFAASTSNLVDGQIWVNDASTVRFLYPAAAPIGVASALGAAAPWAWAAGDLFGGRISFLVA